MYTRVKEDDRIERTLRDLLRQQENRRCINCKSLGPHYVCTTFWTFVCMNCSGLHREFTHRVKSISMAKFTADEVRALQDGGNKKASEVYFKAWDPLHNSFPDGSNLQKLRDFIKHVYIDKKYSGEKGSDNFVMVKKYPEDEFHKWHPSERSVERTPDEFYMRRSFERSSWNDFFERRSSGRYSKGAKDDFSNRHSFETFNPRGRIDDRPSFETFSPRGRIGDRPHRYIDNIRNSPCRQDSMRSGSGHRSRSTQFEIVDDRFRDDELGQRRCEIHRLSSSRSMVGSKSPDSQKVRKIKESTGVKRLKDVMRENIMQSKGSSHKTDDGKDANGSSQNQDIAFSASSISDVESAAKAANSFSLNIFESNPEPFYAAAEIKEQQEDPSLIFGDFLGLPSTTEKGFDTPNANSVETFFLELSIPAVEPTAVIMSEVLPVALSNERNASAAHLIVQSPLFPNYNEDSITCLAENTQTMTDSNNDNIPVIIQQCLDFPSAAPPGIFHPNEDQSYLPSAVNGSVIEQNQHHPSTDPTMSNANAQQSSPSVENLYKQHQTASNAQSPSLSVSTGQSSLAALGQAQVTSSPADGSKSSRRKELPLNLFTSSYSSYHPPVSSWQYYPSHGMGYGAQFHPTLMMMPDFPGSTAPTNPFENTDSNTQLQIPMFPSMSSLQGVVPNNSLSGSLPLSLSPYSGMSSEPYSCGMTTPGVFMGQQVLPANGPLSRQQGGSSFYGSQDALASLNSVQQPSAGAGYSSTIPSSSQYAGRNPFG